MATHWKDDPAHHTLLEWPIGPDAPPWMVRSRAFCCTAAPLRPSAYTPVQQGFAEARRRIFKRSLEEVHTKASVCVWDVGPPPTVCAFTQAWANFTDLKISSISSGTPVDVLAMFPTGEKARYLSDDSRQRIAASLDRFLGVSYALFTGRIDTCRFFLQFVSPVGRLKSCVVHIQALREATGAFRQAVNTYVDLADMPGADFTADLNLPYEVNVDECRLVACSSPPEHTPARSPPREDSPKHSGSPGRTTSAKIKKSDPPHKWRVMTERVSSAQPLVKKNKKTIDPGFKCDFCGTSHTPEVRTGPKGKKTLCNRCGLRWARELDAKTEALADAGLPIA